ncbi:hypothetical protein KCU89_g8090, partial [Aureobasidium melanogenum]
LARSYLLAFALSLTVSAASSDAGYVGYNLTLSGDDDSVIYSTANTRQNASAEYPDPDVYLNASVSVKEIDIEVDNLTAKVNLDLQVLELLQFNAGVDLSIDSVQLLIQDVKAKVLLEARLENLVAMVDDVLGSLDLNPVIATLGQGVGNILNQTGDAVDGLLSGDSPSSSSSQAVKRSFMLDDNILYSINDFSGNSHTNRILEQDGDIVEQDLDNDGRVSGTRVVGSYAKDMTFTGHEDKVQRNGKQVERKQYKYEPIHGVQAVAAIFFDAFGHVVGTQILSELEVGGHATIEADETNFSSLSFRDSERIGSRIRDTFRELKTDARTHDLEDVDSSGDGCGPAMRPLLRDIHLCTPCAPGHSRVSNNLWTADIYQQGCHNAAEPQDNPEYTFTRQDSLPCTSIQGYGYQSVYFDDTTGGFFLNAYTDADCTVPLTQDFAGDGCIIIPEGQ